ncbi:hypothetical protein VNO78_01174 [Psophocarpus tetragonolobus]|uniref:3'-5' exonuclease domain-containing protein n=1 Tax=Psophocarpus tetragonolobus TaxID=3891 RepID=A0AAN9SZ87_PSOTE
MASSSGSHIRNLPLPLLPPVYTVTKPSELPSEFLEPSAASDLVIGFDSEGVNLGREGSLCIMQLAIGGVVYLVDALQGGNALMQACKPALESNQVTKVIHDCKRDSEALFFQFGIKLNNVVDTQIAYSLIEEQEGRKKVPRETVSLVDLLADIRYCGVSYVEKKQARDLLEGDPYIWARRPLSEIMLNHAANDVRFLVNVYGRMIKKLSDPSLWHLAVRSALHCRCYCDNTDWPALPPIPETPNPPEEEMLLVIEVPPHKMGAVIGTEGKTIVSIKRRCDADILTGKPSNKVFLIGPVSQVRQAETILNAIIFNKE